LSRFIQQTYGRGHRAWPIIGLQHYRGSLRPYIHWKPLARPAKLWHSNCDNVTLQPHRLDL